MKNRKRAYWATLALLVPLAACGSDSDAKSTSQDTDESVVTAAHQRLDDIWYPGTNSEPPAESPAPTKGKKVWAISVGLACASCNNSAEKFKEGAAKLGWDARVVDAKFDSNLMISGIRDAIRAKADGIWLYAIDCAVVKSGLEEAKAAGIPVVASQSYDCGTVQDGAENLFTHETGYAIEGGKDVGIEEWHSAWGRSQADWVIAKTDGKAKVIDFKETDLQATIVIEDSFKKQLALCPGCEIVDTIEFVGTDYGPALQQKVEQALLKHPDADVVYGTYDTPVASGMAQAVRAAGRKADMLLVGADGEEPNIELVHDGFDHGGPGYELGWDSYAALDSFIRLFAGEKPTASTGQGVQVWDQDHNLPDAGDVYSSGIDWQGMYEKAWGL